MNLKKYYQVGKLLIKTQGGETRAKYGNGLIKEYSKRLTNELETGYTVTALKRMRQLYIIIEKGANQLTWSHYKNIQYYLSISII